MRHLSSFLRTLAVVLLFAGNLAAQTPAAGKLAQHAEVAAAIQVLDAWISATMANREQPGLSVGIVYDQELIWSKGYGLADVEKKVAATPATVYRIASISKLFTSTAILQLRDAGKLHLDDPVAKHLPWFRIKNSHPQGPVITIRHLITHTSGIPNEPTTTNWNDYYFPTREEMIRGLTEQETILAAETDGELTLIIPEADNPWESRITLKPAGLHTFRMQGGSSSGELLRFEVDSSGRVTRMVEANDYWLRK